MNTSKPKDLKLYGTSFLAISASALLILGSAAAQVDKNVLLSGAVEMQCRPLSYYAETDIFSGEGVFDDVTAVPAGISLEKPPVDIGFCPPLKKGRHTSLFGFRLNPVSGIYKFHKGYDIAAPYGTPILAVADGTVSKVGFDKKGYGNFVILQHSDGVKSIYAHCSKVLVKKDDKVTAGQTVAKVGSTGGSTGNHLHIEIEIGGVKYDPEWFFGGIYG